LALLVVKQIELEGSRTDGSVAFLPTYRLKPVSMALWTSRRLGWIALPKDSLRGRPTGRRGGYDLPRFLHHQPVQKPVAERAGFPPYFSPSRWPFRYTPPALVGLAGGGPVDWTDREEGGHVGVAIDGGALYEVLPPSTRGAALYVGVSTSDRGQSVENQLQPCSRPLDGLDGRSFRSTATSVCRVPEDATDAPCPG
jgi:hypothetical protein